MNASVLVTSAGQTARLSRRSLARRAGTSPATLAAYESGRVDPGTATLRRVLGAAGLEMEATLVHRAYDDEDERAAEIIDVLLLAEQFPARHDAVLRFPRLPAA
jgi:transcriptional regulator with XRE-family HTH domain